jgi:hypothetical protein
MTTYEVKMCKERGLSAAALMLQLNAERDTQRRFDEAAILRVYGATAFELIWERTK